MVTVLHPAWLFIGLPLVAAAAYWYWFHYRHPVYLYSSLAPLKNRTAAQQWRRIVLFLLRLTILLALIGALARFQRPDERSKIPVQGVDIMLVLDASESMMIPEDDGSRKSRMEAAREEALAFIDKRQNDPIGLVIFAGEALSRCPLTLDKKMLRELLLNTDTQTIPVHGTVLSRALLTAANRLKKSKAKSRIIIALTDGDPRNDIDPRIAIDMAKKMGIKIYTIGIGSEEPLFIQHPFFGSIQVPPVNSALLKRLADETGGQFFLARNAADMRKVYDTIDALEKTEYETPLYQRYYEYFTPFLWCAFLLLLLEIILSSFLWVRL